MATLPTIEELEKEVFKIFKHFGSKPGDVLRSNSFDAIWFKSPSRTGEELGRALKSMVDKGYIDELESGNAFRLTDKGFAAM